MRGYITEAIAKERAKAALKDFVWQTLVNAACTYFIVYRWMDAPAWGAFIVFLLWQQGDARRRTAKYGRSS